MKTKTRFGEIRKLGDDVENTRTVEFVISTNEKDRHGTVIPIDGWQLENYNKNGIVGFQHDVYGSMFGGANPDTILGKGLAYVDGRELIGKVTFEPSDVNPLAEKIFKKILHGTLRAASVGFMEIGKGKWGEEDEAEDGKNATYYYDGAELLEWSIVTIPSNPNALKRATKEEKGELVNFILRDALEDNYDEKLTIKGINNILGFESENSDPAEYLEKFEDREDLIKCHEDKN